MRVLFLIDTLGSGGAERQLILLFEGFRARGVDANLIYYHPDHHYLGQVSERDRVECLSDGMLPTGFALRRRIQVLAPDVVLSFLRGPSAWIDVCWPIRPPFRWVVCERSSDLHYAGPLRLQHYLHTLRRADAVVLNSHTATNRLVKAGIDRSVMHYMPNGISLRGTPSEQRPPGDLRLLMVGSITSIKNHLAVVRALASLAEEPWTLEVVGRPAEPDLANAIQAEIDSSGFTGRIVLQGEQQAVAPFYERADVLVLPSLFEGFPNVLLEAWAHGCAVAVSDRTDLPLLVDDGENGRVFSLDKPGEIARVLSEIIAAGRPRAAEMGAKGLAKVRQHYALDAVVDEWLRLLDAIIHGPRRSRVPKPRAIARAARLLWPAAKGST